MGSHVTQDPPPKLSLAQAMLARTRLEEVRAVLGQASSFRARVALVIVLTELEREVARASAELRDESPLGEAGGQAVAV